MSTWVLFLVMVNAEGPSITAVDGWLSKAECEQAGAAFIAKFDGWLRETDFLCVEQRKVRK